MSKKYSLKEVSEMFHIPKSTLRYWESEHIIASNRNDDNDYREYTNEDLIVLADILFYRSLNVPIHDLKHLYNHTIQENMNILFHSYDDITKQITELQRVQSKIQKRIKAGIIYENLIHETPTYTQPYFDKIIHMHIGQTKNVLDYIEDQSILATVFHWDDDRVEVFGIIGNGEQVGEVIWEKHNSISYYPCHIILCEGMVDKQLLMPLLQKIKDSGFQPGNIIINYLITDKTNDYYQAWIEMLPIV